MYHYQAKLVRVIDGDTVDLDVDLGFGVVLAKQRFRLKGINTPELKGNTQVAGIAAANHLVSLLQAPVIEIQTTIVKDKDAVDKYGRWLAVLWVGKVLSGPMLNVNQAMIDAGHAVKFMA